MTDVFAGQSGGPSSPGNRGENGSGTLPPQREPSPSLFRGGWIPGGVVPGEIELSTTRELCRSCGSRLHEFVKQRGRHWNCELPLWMTAWDESDTRPMGQRHLVSTGVRWAHCGCGRWVLVALAEGVSETVEPGVVSPVEELNGLLIGKQSFDLIRVSGRTELMRRDFIRQQSRDFPVVLSHDNCGHRVFADDPIDSWKKKKSTPAESDSRAVPSPSGAATVPPPF